MFVSFWLKWSAFGVGYASPLFEIAPQLELFLIQFELLLGLWLVSGLWMKLAWGVTLVLFSGFTGVSLSMVIEGRSSCGCFGAVEVSPIWMLLFDIVAIALLLLCSRKILNRSRVVLNGALAGAGLTASLLMMFNATNLTSWTVQQLSPKLTGQYLVTVPAVIDLGKGPADEWRTLELTVFNRSSEPITLVGAEHNCKCRAEQDLPVTIPAQEKATIRVSVRLGRTSGKQFDRFWLRTSHQRQPLLLCRWQATVQSGSIGYVERPAHENQVNRG